MALKDIICKLFKKSGAKNTLGDLGLNAIVDQLQNLGKTAEAGDQKSITDIVAIIKRAIENKDEWGKIVEKCIAIAKTIGNGGLREAVMALLKK